MTARDCPWLHGRYAGSQRRVLSVPCDEKEEEQRWIFHSPTTTFRPSTDASHCLDLVAPAPGDAPPAEGEDADALDGSSLGAWPCVPGAANEKFAYDRYMSRYCVRARASTCVVEAIQGAPMRLRYPGRPGCLHYDAHGSMQALRCGVLILGPLCPGPTRPPSLHARAHPEARHSRTRAGPP